MVKIIINDAFKSKYSYYICYLATDFAMNPMRQVLLLLLLLTNQYLLIDPKKCNTTKQKKESKEKEERSESHEVEKIM